MEELEKNLICGLIMPISSIDGCNEEHWIDVKEVLQEAVTKAGFKAELVSDSEEIGIIQKRIIQNLYYNPIVVCDVSGKNPNVMFELGLRLAFDRPTIIIKDDKTDYSFDTSIIEHIEYPRDLRYSKIVGFKEKLSLKIKATYDKSINDKEYTTFIGHFIAINGNNIEIKEDIDPKKNNLENSINRFLIAKNREGLKEKSLKNYKLELMNKFLPYVQKNVSEITKDDIKSYLTYRDDDYKKTRNTMECIRNILNSYFKWLEEEENIIPKNIVKGIKAYKIQDNVTRPLTNDELSKIRNSCKDLRERAVIEFLCSTGCRLNEIVNIKIEDINWENKEVLVYDTNNILRSVFLNSMAEKALKDFLQSRENINTKEIFIRSRSPYSKLSPRSFEMLIEKIVKRTDISENIAPLNFRSTFSRIMSENGCPTNILMTLLGNKDIYTTIANFNFTTQNKNHIFEKYFDNK